LSISNAAFNEETDSTPASPYMGYHQPASAPADASPGWAASTWTNEWVSLLVYIYVVLFVNIPDLFVSSVVYSVLVENTRNKNLYERERQTNKKHTIWTCFCFSTYYRI